MICSPVYVFGNIYFMNVSIVGQNKKDKKFTLLTYMLICVCMCIYTCVTVSMDHLFS